MTTTAREQYIVDAHGTKVAVILSIEHYEQVIEDIHDLAIVAECRVEQLISFAEIKKTASQLHLNRNRSL